MDYTTVFDVAQSGYRQWWFPTVGLVVVANISWKLFVRREFTAKSHLYSARFALGWFFCGTLLAFVATFGDYKRTSSALRNGHCQVTEGIVTDFHPMPYEGHQNEWFVVKGERFEYSDYVITAGFNNTASHGGPVHKGIQVRIHHLGNKIARLEVAWWTSMPPVVQGNTTSAGKSFP